MQYLQFPHTNAGQARNLNFYVHFAVIKILTTGVPIVAQQKRILTTIHEKVQKSGFIQDQHRMVTLGLRPWQGELHASPCMTRKMKLLFFNTQQKFISLLHRLSWEVSNSGMRWRDKQLQESCLPAHRPTTQALDGSPHACGQRGCCSPSHHAMVQADRGRKGQRQGLPPPF